MKTHLITEAQIKEFYRQLGLIQKQIEEEEEKENGDAFYVIALYRRLNAYQDIKELFKLKRPEEMED